MTAFTTQPKVKAKLAEITEDRANLSGVQVAYGHPGKRVESEFISFKDIAGDQEARELGNHRRFENYVVEVEVNVLRKGNEQQAVTERAYELAAEVEEAVRAEPTLGSLVVDAQIVGPFDLTEQFSEQGRLAAVFLGVRVRARI